MLILTFSEGSLTVFPMKNDRRLSKILKIMHSEKLKSVHLFH